MHLATTNTNYLQSNIGSGLGICPTRSTISTMMSMTITISITMKIMSIKIKIRRKPKGY